MHDDEACLRPIRPTRDRDRIDTVGQTAISSIRLLAVIVAFLRCALKRGSNNHSPI
jgi:hypothetical protein